MRPCVWIVECERFWVLFLWIILAIVISTFLCEATFFFSNWDAYSEHSYICVTNQLENELVNNNSRFENWKSSSRNVVQQTKLKGIVISNGNVKCFDFVLCFVIHFFPENCIVFDNFTFTLRIFRRIGWFKSCSEMLFPSKNQNYSNDVFNSMHSDGQKPRSSVKLQSERFWKGFGLDICPCVRVIFHFGRRTETFLLSIFFGRTDGRSSRIFTSNGQKCVRCHL